jgi:hypothetical protein
MPTTKNPDPPSNDEMVYQSTASADTKPPPARPAMPVRIAMTRERSQLKVRQRPPAAKTRVRGAGRTPTPNRLLQVLADQFGHLEHVGLRLAAEHGLEFVVGLDHPLVLRVLQIVLLDVCPEPLGDFGASAELGVTGFMNAALALRAGAFFADFLALFAALAVFAAFFLAIRSPLKGLQASIPSIHSD